MKTKYTDFINEEVNLNFLNPKNLLNNKYILIHDRLKELGKQFMETYDIIMNIEHKELSPILSKVIDTNDKELVQKLIDYQPKGLYISNYSFLHQKIYELNEKPVSKSEITNYDVPFSELNIIFQKLKEQSDIRDGIEDESTALINEIIETDDINIFRRFTSVVQNLPSASVIFYENFYRLKDKNKKGDK